MNIKYLRFFIRKTSREYSSKIKVMKVKLPRYLINFWFGLGVNFLQTFKFEVSIKNLKIETVLLRLFNLEEGGTVIVSSEFISLVSQSILKLQFQIDSMWLQL